MTQGNLVRKKTKTGISLSANFILEPLPIDEPVSQAIRSMPISALMGKDNH